MQTFLPYASFEESARCLDNKRLGKQRVEVLQIYNALTKKTGWRYHPIVKMWAGYESALLEYGANICQEWIDRGFVDNLRDKFLMDIVPMQGIHTEPRYPSWLGNEAFHASHRSNLLRKDPIWYGKFGWKEPNNLPYVWIKGV